MRIVFLALLLCGCASVPKTHPMSIALPANTCPDSIVVVKHIHDAPEAERYKAQLDKWKSYAKLLETRLGINPKEDSDK